MEQSIPGQSQNPSSHEGKSRDSKGGNFTQAPMSKPEPAALQAMGVSARDWAKLPPLMQQDLLNAAQQNSLPAYRESIKNYFEKIARLKEPNQSQDQTND
jgi:hypothetical protein